MARTIGLLEVRDLVRDIVISDPDKIAKDYYVINDKPECVVGVLLASLGWPLNNLREGNITNAYTVTHAPNAAGVKFTAEARLFLQTLQEQQDAAFTWWQAYHHACTHYTDHIEAALLKQALSDREAV